MAPSARRHSLFLSVLVLAGLGMLAAAHAGLPPIAAAPVAAEPMPLSVGSVAPAPTLHRGVTGTTELPSLPAGISAAGIPAALDGSIEPARPFVLRGTPTDQARALQCLTTAIYYEAASEPDDGQRAVAQVVLNRVRHPAFPATVCGVVFQGVDRPVCQFSFACDGAMARRPAPAAWARARRVAMAALDGAVFAPVGLATHYHTYAVTPSWNRSLVMTGMFGAHLFHRWKGWWGTPAAFRDRYAGAEPSPLTAPVPKAALATSLPGARPSAPEQPGQVVTDGTAATTPEPSRLPESQILDRWRDSGKPLI